MEEGATTTKTTKKRAWTYVLLGCMPLALTACGDAEAEPSAYEECVYEKEHNGQWELDCDDDSSSSSWYKKKGYSKKSSLVSKSSSYYKSHSGIGSSGYSSGG